jgi:cytochrome c
VRFLVPLAFSLAIAACARRSTPSADDGGVDLYDGEHAFAFHCAKCHAPDRFTTGPSLREIAALYAKDPEGVVRWAKAPGRRRPGADRMPSFEMLGDETLRNVAAYMIAMGSK